MDELLIEPEPTERELGTAPIKPLFARYAAITFAGMLAQMVMVVLEGLIIGNGLGPLGLAAVTVILPLELLNLALGGALGMAVAVVGTILPPMIILSVISLFYAAFATNPYVALVLRGMQAGVAAVILDVVCSLGAGVIKERSALSIVLMIAAFLATFVLVVNVVYIILAAALVGVGKILVLRRARKEGAK